MWRVCVWENVQSCARWQILRVQMWFVWGELHLGRNNRELINHRQKVSEKKSIRGRLFILFGGSWSHNSGFGWAVTWLWGRLSCDPWFGWTLTRFGRALALCSIRFLRLALCLPSTVWLLELSLRLNVARLGSEHIGAGFSVTWWMYLVPLARGFKLWLYVF